MKKCKLKFITLLLLFIMMFSFSTTVYAAEEDTAATEDGIRLGTGDAVNDILLDNRFEGAIESISFITKFVDHWFTVIITATAFFIISAAMLKNVMAGAYCSNHKFWDKVAIAHQSADAVSVASIGQYVFDKQFLNTTGGGLKGALLCLVPNIKAWTDFDDADIEPKQYFMKAIPQMIACVIIGVFIYNGYYRSTAATVGDFGSEICNRLFSSIDAGKMVDKITLTSRPPENVYKSDPTVEGQYRYTISMAAYKIMVSSFSDYTSTEQKTSLMRNCEKFAYKVTTNDKFKAKFITKVANTNKEYTLSNCKVSLTPSSECPIKDQLIGGDLVWMDDTFTEDSSETSFVAGYAKIEGFGLSPIGLSASSNDTFYITCSMKKVARKSSVNNIASKLISNGSSTSAAKQQKITTTATLTGVDSNAVNVAIKGTKAYEDKVVAAVKAAITNNSYSLKDGTQDSTIVAKINGRAEFSSGNNKSSTNIYVRDVPVTFKDPNDSSKTVEGRVDVEVAIFRSLQ